MMMLILCAAALAQEATGPTPAPTVETDASAPPLAVSAEDTGGSMLDGAARAKQDGPPVHPYIVGGVSGCCLSGIGCLGATLAYALIEPEAPVGLEGSDEYLYAYIEQQKKERAKAAFIGGTVGTVVLAGSYLALNFLVLATY